MHTEASNHLMEADKGNFSFQHSLFSFVKQHNRNPHKSTA
jgi:hypothetical protein